MFGKLFANNLVKEGNAPMFDDPKEFDLAYENVSFQAGMSIPKFIKRSTNKYIKSHTDFDYQTNTWRPFVKDVSVPTLMIQNVNDGYLDREFIEGVFDDLQVEKEMMWLELPKMKNATHNRLAAYDWLGPHPEPILGWFGKYV